MSVFRRFSKPWRRTILVRLVIASYLSIDRHVTMSPVRRFPESFSYFGQHLRILVLTNLSCMFSFVAESYLLHMQEHLLDKKNKYRSVMWAGL